MSCGYPVQSMPVDEESEGSVAAPRVEAALIVAAAGGLERTSILSCLALAFGFLPPKGSLVLCLDALDAEVMVDGTAPLTVGLAQLTSLAGRCGFEPATDPGYAAAANSGASTCRGMVFERARQVPRWRLTHVAAGDFEAFSILFLSAFGHAISLPLWRWKYAKGRGCAVGAWRGKDLIAHYGGSLRTVLAFGLPVQALQVCDAMVDPRERGVMTKTGAMFQVTAAFLECYQGLAHIPLAFGFPNWRAMRLGERLGFYAEVGALCELRWPAMGKLPRLSTRLRYLDPQSVADRRATGELWSAMARDLEDGLVGVRDWTFLRHRYLEHPDHRYELVLVTSRFTLAPLGLLVLRQEAAAIALTDLVAPLKNIPLLLVQARRLAGLWGRTSLYCWITRQHAFRFVTKDMAERDIQVSIPTNTWVPQPFTPEQLHDRWWLTLGDTDFL